MTQLEVLANARTTQIQITILHTNIIATVGIVLNGEGRGLTLAEYVQLLSQYLNVTRRHLGILSLSLTNSTFDLNAPLTSQTIGFFAQFSVLRLVEHQLGDAITVAQVDKRHTTHLTGFLYPSGQRHLAAGIGETKLTTCFSSIHLLYVLCFPIWIAKVHNISDMGNNSAK